MTPPMLIPTLAAAAVAAAVAQPQTCCGPDVRRDLRVGDTRLDAPATPAPTPGVRSPAGPAAGPQTLVGGSGTAVTALFPRSNLNAASGDTAGGVQFVIGPIPDWLARQHGFAIAADAAPPPPTMLDRLLRPTELSRRIERTRRRVTDPGPLPGRIDAPRSPSLVLGRDLSVRSLLRSALAAESP